MVRRLLVIFQLEKSWFVYNNGENPVPTQYLTDPVFDPILVVFTPTSTGDSFISKICLVYQCWKMTLYPKDMRVG